MVLLITIIILLIQAGITISTLTGEKGYPVFKLNIYNKWKIYQKYIKKQSTKYNYTLKW